jgi:hypothetical protein
VALGLRAIDPSTQFNCPNSARPYARHRVATSFADCPFGECMPGGPEIPRVKLSTEVVLRAPGRGTLRSQEAEGEPVISLTAPEQPVSYRTAFSRVVSNDSWIHGGQGGLVGDTYP